MVQPISPAMLQGPIPGQSLTQEPQAAPWENPPEMSTIQEVIEYYTEKMLSMETEDAILFALDEGISVERMAEYVSTSGTMNGRHSLDLAFLVDPYVRELIRYVADTAGVSYVTSYSDMQKEGNVPYRQMRQIIKTVCRERPQTVAEAPAPEQQPQGLMARQPQGEE